MIQKLSVKKNGFVAVEKPHPGFMLALLQLRHSSAATSQNFFHTWSVQGHTDSLLTALFKSEDYRDSLQSFSVSSQYGMLTKTQVFRVRSRRNSRFLRSDCR